VNLLYRLFYRPVLGRHQVAYFPLKIQK
jgi:hypothetical protein